jgi:hypothetical protein
MSGAVLGKSFTPYEAHIPFELKVSHSDFSKLFFLLHSFFFASFFEF